MKNIVINLIIILSIFLVSCEKENTKVSTDSTYTNLTISFNNTVAGVPINTVVNEYTNAYGNKYTVSLLKYYVTNIILIDENKREYLAKNYNLIDLNEPTQNTITLKNIPLAKYVKMKFILGVDSARNTSGVQDGFLDPSYGMIWTWNTGYIFFKHEGNYVNTENVTKPLRLHLGTAPARGFVEVALPLLNINTTLKNITIDFDLNKAYAAKSIIDFNIDNNRQSSEAADSLWITQLKSNLENAFTFAKAN